MKSLKLLLITAAAVALSSCSKVPAGNVGVKVYLLGSAKGVDHEVLGPGRYYIGWNEELYRFPVFQQNYTWAQGNKGEPDESISFQTQEGLTINADFGITYSIEPAKVSELFQKYRRGVDEITDTFLRNMVRDSINARASTMSVESVYGKGKADLIKTAETDVRDWVTPFGMRIEKVYLIGEFRLPEQIKNALNAKIAATQMAQQRENEVAQARAEADKIRARDAGIRDGNKMLAESLTPELMQMRWLEKWDGHLPTVITGGGEGQNGLMMMVPSAVTTPPAR